MTRTEKKTLLAIGLSAGLGAMFLLFNRSNDGNPFEDFDMAGMLGVPRGGPWATSMPDAVVLHESVGWDIPGAIGAMRSGGYGVHWLIDGEGQLESMVERNRWAQHVEKASQRAYGIEVINPYQWTGKSWTESLPNVLWPGHNYTLPTNLQLMRLWDMLENSGVRPVGTGWERDMPAGPGIYAHAQLTKPGKHIDGVFPLLYLQARFAGKDHEAARAEAIDRWKAKR
jgi:hypothetical protein